MLSLHSIAARNQYKQYAITLQLLLIQHYHHQSDTLLKPVRVLLLSMHRLHNDVDGGIYRHKLAGISKVVPSIKERRGNQMMIGPGNEEGCTITYQPHTHSKFYMSQWK